MPGPFTATHDDVDSVVAWTVIRAARELSRRLGEELAPFDLSPVEFGTLVQLATEDELNQADLARAVGVRPQSMSAVSTGLETRRLVERGSAPGRGRASRMRLTPGGRDLLARAWPRVLASNAWFPDGGAQITAGLRAFTDGSTPAGPGTV